MVSSIKEKGESWTTRVASTIATTSSAATSAKTIWRWWNCEFLNSSWKIFWNQELREQTKVFERLVREVCKGDDPFQDFMDQLNSIPFDWVSTDQVAKMRLKSSSPRSTERTAVSSLDESPTKVSWKTELCFKLLQPLGRRSMCVFSLITGESATSAE